MTYVTEWARLFALTLGVELAVAVPLLGKDDPLARRAGAVAFAQLASHPLVWFVIPTFGLAGARFLLLAEGWALASELVFYRLVFPRLTWRRALAISALANGASMTVGGLLR